jgi:hypothetical protein
LSGQRANYTFIPDGTALGKPLITLDENEGKSEEEVLHELLHLQLVVKRGVEIKGFSLPPGVDEALPKAAPQLLDIFEHWVFYPQMYSMGFDPNKKLSEEFKDIISKDTALSSPWFNRTPILRAVKYAEVAAVNNDPDLTRTLEGWFTRRGWVEYIATGKRLEKSIRAIRAADVTTLDGEGRQLTA